MGRTISKFRDEEDDRRGKSSKNVKHSKNTRGTGMRVINNWSEHDNREDDYFDDEYDANTTQTQRKGKQNGY